MKRTVMMMTMMLSFVVDSVADIEKDHLLYELNDTTGTAMVTGMVLGYENPNYEAVIPEKVEYNGTSYTVTAIGEYALSKAKSVSIPRTVTDIATGAFSESSVRTLHITDLEAWCRIRFAEGQWSHPCSYSTGRYGTSGEIDVYLNEELLKDLVIPESSLTVCRA